MPFLGFRDQLSSFDNSRSFNQNTTPRQTGTAQNDLGSTSAALFALFLALCPRFCGAFSFTTGERSEVPHNSAPDHEMLNSSRRNRSERPAGRRDVRFLSGDESGATTCSAVLLCCVPGRPCMNQNHWRDRPCCNPVRRCQTDPTRSFRYDSEQRYAGRTPEQIVEFGSW